MKKKREREREKERRKKRKKSTGKYCSRYAPKCNAHTQADEQDPEISWIMNINPLKRNPIRKSVSRKSQLLLYFLL